MTEVLTAQATVEVAVAPAPAEIATATSAPLPPPRVQAISIRAAVVRSAWRDLRRFMTLFFASTTLLACFHVVRLEYGDVRDYSTFVGTVGPVAVVDDAAGTPSAGPPETVFHPGDRVGWTASFCAAPGHPYTAYVSLVQVGGSPGGVSVDSRVRRFSGDAHRCGPLFGFLTLPADAAPGNYRGLQHGVFREGTWWPLRFDFPGFAFTVVPKPEVATAASTNRSTDNP